MGEIGGFLRIHRVGFEKRDPAERVVRDWDDVLGSFVKVMPRDYKRALAELAAEGEEVAT